MAHSTECTNNFDPNCEECIAWKKYREDLRERRKFLESYWIHLDKPKNSVITSHHEIKDADNSFRNFQVSKPTADSVCPNCEISFKTKKTLKAHIKTIHDRKHVYSCVECGENFFRRDYLDAHMRGHRDEKTFSCDQCAKYFKHKQTLNKHVKICNKKAEEEIKSIL